MTVVGGRLDGPQTAPGGPRRNFFGGNPTQTTSARSSVPPTPTPRTMYVRDVGPPSRVASRNPSHGRPLQSESTVTLPHKPTGMPLPGTQGRNIGNDPQSSKAGRPSRSSSLVTSDEDLEDVKKTQVEEESVEKRLQDLGRMMSSQMLGFARQARNPAPANEITAPASQPNQSTRSSDALRLLERGKEREENILGPAPLPPATEPMRGRGLQSLSGSKPPLVGNAEPGGVSKASVV